MRDDTHPEHWHFHQEAAAEFAIQINRFKANLESLAAGIAAAEGSDDEIGAARALNKEINCVLRHVATTDLPPALKRFQSVEVQTTRQLNKFIKMTAAKYAARDRR